MWISRTCWRLSGAFIAALIGACSSGSSHDGGSGRDVAIDSTPARDASDTATDRVGGDDAVDAILAMDARDEFDVGEMPLDATGADVIDAGSDTGSVDDLASADASDLGIADGACGAVGDTCASGSACCSGLCSPTAGTCLAGSCGLSGAACTANADCCSATCVSNRCTAVHVVGLDDDRDRVLETLALVQGQPDRCAQWTALDNIQKGIFLTHSDLLGNRSCTENAAITSGSLDGSGNCGGSNACTCAPGSDMAFAHVFKLWTVNGSDPTCACTEGSDGYNCCNGGGEWHRIFFTADDVLIDYFRRVGAGLPEWNASTDLGGPHAPFDQSDETVLGQPRGQSHFWTRDSDATVLTRTGVNGVLEPHIVELDNDYNVLHDSNPEGCYGFFGLGCSYGRIQFRSFWMSKGNRLATTFRGNGEPSMHSELAADAVYSPRCATAHIDAIAPSTIGRGRVITLNGLGFTDCTAHLGCGNEVHVRTHAGEVVIGPGSPFDLAESATAITVQIPQESGTGEAYVWVVVGGVLSNLVPSVVGP